ncbi:hypothetical protein MKX03_023883 [Papaver bracteatum]|nr:hypothetical protein MKX03_023883 [Papaver bracteatum]
MSSRGELACTYATLILHDTGMPITVDKIAVLLKAANVQCESYWPSLFAKLSEKRNTKDLIISIGAGGGCGAAASVAVSGSTAAESLAAEKKRDEDIRARRLFDSLFSCFCC